MAVAITILTVEVVADPMVVHVEQMEIGLVDMEHLKVLEELGLVEMVHLEKAGKETETM